MSLELKTITYVGSAPKKTNPFPKLLGGWFLLILAGAIGYWFLQPLVPFLRAQQSGASVQNAEAAIESLSSERKFGPRLAAAALTRTRNDVTYDPAYYPIQYPGGDVPGDRGLSADLVVRSYRALGVDLQELVHEDMGQNFRSYPQFWKLRGPDPNIDHRRVPNLQRYFSRHGESMPLSRDPGEYEVGDVVVWRLPFAASADGSRHIGVVVPGPGARSDEKWVVHNIGSGPEWEDELFSYEVVGHYRFAPRERAMTATLEGPDIQ